MPPKSKKKNTHVSPRRPGGAITIADAQRYALQISDSFGSGNAIKALMSNVPLPGVSSTTDGHGSRQNSGNLEAQRGLFSDQGSARDSSRGASGSWPTYTEPVEEEHGEEEDVDADEDSAGGTEEAAPPPQGRSAPAHDKERSTSITWAKTKDVMEIPKDQLVA